MKGFKTSNIQSCIYFDIYFYNNILLLFSIVNLRHMIAIE